MKGESFDSPQNLLVETKITFGRQTAKASSTLARKENRLCCFYQHHISEYNLETGKTSNRTRKEGYDTAPNNFSNRNLTLLQMKRDSYEADVKNLMVSFKGNENELNANWDRTVDHSLFGT
jgi:hypothetical protein